MPANLSLILNIILLLVVVISISRLIKARRQDLPSGGQPSLGVPNAQSLDDIIAVRKVSDEAEDDEVSTQAVSFEEEQSSPEAAPVQRKHAPRRAAKASFVSRFVNKDAQEAKVSAVNPEAASEKMLMMLLVAKDKHNFAGYELLQTLLAAGLRFGEGSLFHRHQLSNGQGPVIFSLAAATNEGTFDLQNMGAFTARGLCLFMQPSGNTTIDIERFNILYETARQLSEGLDAHLLDGSRRPLTKESLASYQQSLGSCVESEDSVTA